MRGLAALVVTATSVILVHAHAHDHATRDTSSTALTAALQDIRLIKFGPAKNDTAKLSVAALDALHETLHSSASRTALLGLQKNPLFENVDSRVLLALSRDTYGCGPGYVDLSDALLPAVNSPSPASSDMASVPAVDQEDITIQATFPTPNPSAYPELTSMFTGVNGAGLTSFVKTLSTNFTTRYYRSSIARQSSTWIQQQWTSIVGSSSVSLIENSFDQPNVIAAIPAAASSTNTEIVVIGAHLDSINQRSTTGVAPGADDDASGIAVLTQVLQILAASGYRGLRRIEAHAYAGEEGGLLGSSRTASQYKSAGKVVRAMLQMDMVGYQTGTKPVITMINDTSIDSGLKTFTRGIISSYASEATMKTAACGYACSDHSPWIDQGFPAGCISEAGPDDSALNPYYHTANDTYDKINMDKATVFVKAVLAFAVEASERAPA
ncbi:Zn-dependent exopeptidase [Auriculariales sp. MPI-PUGE-AT-0066]|nr:Zn-dependent exopeptidase [Auriculariales sp. MPI-PUGE-AT-0066]